MSRPGWPGRGAPPGAGWHIECATIALDTIGMGFDVQGGGSDLVFRTTVLGRPREALTATKPFARAYVHAAMIGLDGEKMSKSRGNLVFVSKLRGEGVDPMAIRLALLSGHYRTDRAWTADLLGAAEERLATWRRAVALDAGAPAAPVLLGLRERLADDLDSPGAIALIDAWAARSLAGDPDPDAEDEAPRIGATPSTRCSVWRWATADDRRAVPPRRPGGARTRRGAPGAGRGPGRGSRGRANPEPEDPLRTAFERDRDRILHAKAFRRLKHKTQVFLNPDGDHFVTRLTHTLQVTQVARSLARALGLNETLAGRSRWPTTSATRRSGTWARTLEPYVPGGWHTPRRACGSSRCWST